MTGLDNEGGTIAAWEPKGAGHVLVLAFSDLADMLLFQERATAAMRADGDPQDEPHPTVDTLWMGEAQFGRRSMFGDAVETGLLVSTRDTLRMTEEARRAWALEKMTQETPLPPKRGLSQAWRPSEEQMDLMERFSAEVVEPNPEGMGGRTHRIKVSVARDGFNQFACDMERPDLQFVGVQGGKSFSETIQSVFKDQAQVLLSEGGHPYLHGLLRRPGANRRYFRCP